jgi:hypothetical protein
LRVFASYKRGAPSGRLVCPRISYIAESTRLFHFLWLQVLISEVIFVTQLGRKFRIFSSTVQRYENFRVPPNYFTKKARKKARNNAKMSYTKIG